MKTDTIYPPVKVAVMIDGGFFIKRFNTLYNKDGKMTGKDIAEALYSMAMRCFMSVIFSCFCLIVVYMLHNFKWFHLNGSPCYRRAICLYPFGISVILSNMSCAYSNNSGWIIVAAVRLCRGENFL